jgi:hypothetical protein
MASCASPAQCPNLLEISNDDASGAHLSTWDTSNGATCQVYIANWTDTSISLVANLQVGLQDDYELAYQSGVYLTPLSDISPASFPAVPPVSAIGCPVAYKDHLYFTVTNPQSGATVKQPFQATVGIRLLYWPIIPLGYAVRCEQCNTMTGVVQRGQRLTPKVPPCRR